MNELPPGLKDAVLATAARTPSLTRAQHHRRRALVLALGLLGTLAVGFSRGLPSARPVVYLAIGAGAAGLLALFASRYVLWVPASALGRRRWTLRALALSVPLLLAAAALFAARFAPLGGSADPMVGSECVAVYLALGVPLLGLLVWLERDSDPLDPRASAASLAAIAAACSTFALALRCPAVGSAHVLVSHVAPAIVLIAAGALAGARWVALRRPTSRA